MERNLILIGFMGSGKTTVGKRFSLKMQVPFKDTDVLIEEREQRSVSEIFRTEGEMYFRDKETELLTEIAGSACTCTMKSGISADATEVQSLKKIISVGGGTPVREQNRPLLKKCGTVVYLRVRPETVYERLKGDTTRPLLSCADPLTRIRELMESRREAYEGSADYVIDVDGMEPDEICDRLSDLLD